jgi:WD40 repeat protein
VHGLKAYVESVVACARGEIHHLDIIPSVQPWAPDEIRERARNAGAEPSRSDRIRAFSQFLNAERHVLQKLASHPHSFVQHAYNSANSGPVAAAAEAIIEAETQPVFLLRSPHQRPAQNPDPALIRTIEVPGGAIEGVIAASTAGGDVGLTSYGARVVHVWDLETGKRLHTLEGHENRVTCVSVTPDGRRAISGGADDALCVWDLESGRRVNRFRADGSLSCVSITPDGERAFSGSFEKLTLWDLALAQPLLVIERSGMFFADLSVTPDGRVALSLCRRRWSSESTLVLWDLTSGRCLRELAGQPCSDATVRLAADGRRAIAGGVEKHLRVWNLETPESVDTLAGHSRPVLCVAITADGKRAVSGSDDNTLRIWDLDQSRCIKTFEGHTDRVTSLDITPDGVRAVSGSCDGTLRVWDVEKGVSLRESERHRASVTSLDFTPDGRTLVSGGEDLVLRTWDLETGGYLTSLEPEEVRYQGYPDKRAMEGRSRMVFTPGAGRVVAATVTLIPDEWKVGSAGRREQSLRVLDTSDLQECLTIEERACDLDFSPSGRSAIVGSFDNELRVWDLETGECLRNLGIRREGWSDWIQCVSVSPDGKVAAALSSDKTLRLWSLEEAACLRTLEGEGSGLITADGRKMVVSGSDGSLSVLDARSGERLNRFEGCAGTIEGLTVTPDCRYLISGSGDCIVRVWDLGSGECAGIYHAGAAITSISAVSSVAAFGCGTSDGEVMTLAMKNLSLGPMVVTPVRMWLYGRGGASGRWADQLSAACKWCGSRFPVSRKILDVIDAIQRSAGQKPGRSGCLDLPQDAWTDRLLLSECAGCRRPLRYNPFLVDERESAGL